MTEEIKNKISEAAVRLVEYVHDNKFEGILVSGGSNQISRSLFTLAWQSRFKDEKMPKFYIFDQKTNSRLYKMDVSTSALEPEILEWISANLPELIEIKDHNLCYVDDFALSGQKFISLKKLFEQLEFKNLKFAFFGATPISELDEGVFVGTFDLEATRELQTLSLQIQGRPSFQELLKQMEVKTEEHRLRALKALKEIGQGIRLK